MAVRRKWNAIQCSCKQRNEGFTEHWQQAVTLISEIASRRQSDSPLEDSVGRCCCPEDTLQDSSCAATPAVNVSLESVWTPFSPFRCLQLASNLILSRVRLSSCWDTMHLPRKLCVTRLVNSYLAYTATSLSTDRRSNEAGNHEEGH